MDLKRRKVIRRNRLQLELRPEYEKPLAFLEARLTTRSRSDLIQEAIGVLFWYVQEIAQGRKVVSVNPEEIGKLKNAVELVSPTTTVPLANLYTYLVARPHPWRRQLWLKGRNMTVGQLIATMASEELTPEHAAERLTLPEEQVREAMAYAALNRDLIDAEFREEHHRIQAEGLSGGIRSVP